MTNAHKTAISRNKPSAPSRYFAGQELLFGDVLDYGCGKGMDVEYINSLGYPCDGFDPHYAPTFPQRTYDTIICNYVLNVIDNVADRIKTLRSIVGLLKSGGSVLLAVRSDVEASKTKAWKPSGTGYVTSRGTYQADISIEEITHYLKFVETPTTIQPVKSCKQYKSYKISIA